MPTVQLTPFTKAQWLANDGTPLAGGMLFTFAAGTSTPLASYTDSTGATPNPNPVVLDAAGRADVWLNSGTAYKLTMQNSLGVQQWTEDGINPGAAPATLGATNIAGNFSITQPTAATAIANQSSFSESIQAQYWNGSASATDQWTFQDVLGTGTNPTSTLTIAHSGSPGTSSINFPSGSSFGSPTFTGNAVAQNLFAKTFEQVRYADQFTAGADMGAKINLAIADLPGTGGIVDATAFQGVQAAAATININKPCLLKLGGVTLQLAGSPGINLSNTGAGVIGFGPGASILQVNAGTNDAIQSNAINVMAKGFAINSAVARTGGAGIRCKGGNGVYEDFTIDKTFNGIQITDSLSGASGNNVFKRIDMGTLISPAGSWNAGIILGGVASGTVTGEFFQDVNILGTSAFADSMVVLDSGCDTNHFTDCQFSFGGVDAFCASIRNTNISNVPQWNKFTNCVFEAGTTKIGVTHSAGTLNSFISCTLAACSTFFQFNGGVNVHVNECRMVGCQQQAINITAGSDIRISGCRIADSSIQTNAGFNTIVVSANVNDFSIINNDFTTILSSANQPFQNVLVVAGTSDRYWITGNTFANSTGGGLTDSGTGTNKFIHSNSGSTLNIFNGAPVAREIAVVDLTAQTAAIGTTTLYAVPATGAGQYRLTWDSKVTTAAGTSSTLGALTIVYTDPDGNAITVTAGALQIGGTVATTVTTNSVTTAVLTGLPLILNCKAGTNITYAMAYASNAASAMAYNLHIKLEAM